MFMSFFFLIINEIKLVIVILLKLKLKIVILSRGKLKFILSYYHNMYKKPIKPI